MRRHLGGAPGDRAARAFVTLLVGSAAVVLTGCTGTPAAGPSTPAGGSSAPVSATPTGASATTTSGTTSSGTTSRRPIATTTHAAAYPTKLITYAENGSPGAIVPVILSARNIPARGTVNFAISIGTLAGQCDPTTWRSGTLISVKCWQPLPAKAGRAVLQVRGEVIVDGVARPTPAKSRVIKVRGPRTATLTIAQRRSVTHCGNTTKNILLTFDDSADPARMTQLLGVLKKHKVRAGFFVVGTWASHQPKLMAQIRDQGHWIGSHTYDHRALTTLSDKAVATEITRGSAATSPKLVRPGYGAGAYTARVVRIARSVGYSVCHWTTDTGDWEGLSAARIVGRVLHGDDSTEPALAGGVVLMHLHGKHTVEALPAMINGLRAKGLTLDPLH